MVIMDGWTDGWIVDMDGLMVGYNGWMDGYDEWLVMILIDG